MTGSEKSLGLPTRSYQTALITGASAGIGRELASEFARHGHDLVLVARRAEPMEELALSLKERYGIAARVLAKDLLAPGAASELFEELKADGTKIDFLVNNAGVGTYGDFLDTDPLALEAMLQLNILALSTMTRLFAAPMQERRAGAILNVASTAAFQPGPHMAGYFASKAFVLSLTEALAFELAPAGIKVSALCPGPTVSEFQERANMHASRMVQRSQLMMSAAEVARAGYDGLMAGQVIKIPGVANKLTATAPRFLPRCLVTRLSAYVAGGH